jgi:hypothetical protein
MTTTILGQTRKPFTTPAYQYIRRTDKLPTTDEAWAQKDPTCKVKLFDPTGSWTWYVAGFDPDTGLAFGVVNGFEKEMGDFDMADLVLHRGSMRLPIERDLYWKPAKASELLR